MSFDTRIVQTINGPVRGIKRDGAGIQYYTYFRIPYAKPPTGELRFKAPQKIEPWTEVHDGTKEGPICPQVSFIDGFPDSDNQSEDCLYVNVYTKVFPDALQPRSLPVVVMIHGGGFNLGSSGELMGGPEFLLQHDIVYISVNYRLGTFGFLSIPDRSFDIPGNAGLKDQSMALRWVRDNCATFGGNPENITIMGISAGGASVHYHLISDHSKHLFHRAIVQSGSALNSWANRPHNDDLNERLSRSLGWDGTGGNTAMWQTIIDAPASSLAKHAKAIINDHDHQNGLLFPFVPTVEPYDNGTIFIDRDLTAMNKTAWSFEIPILIGGTSGEGYMIQLEYSGRTNMFKDNAYFDNALPRELGLPLESDERRRLGESLRKFYYGSETPSIENIDTYSELLTEKQFWHGIYAIVKARAFNPKAAETYLYHFDFSSDKLVFMQTLMAGKHTEKMIHGEDMLYQFRTPAIHDQLDDSSVENSICMSFAETGKPTSDATASLNWEPVLPCTPFKCLNITAEPSVIDLPLTKRIEFWDTIFEY